MSDLTISDLTVGDRVRYTGDRYTANGEAPTRQPGSIGTVTALGVEEGVGRLSQHVHVEWDDGAAIATYPFVSNLERVSDDDGVSEIERAADEAARYADRLRAVAVAAREYQDAVSDFTDFVNSNGGK